MRSKGNRIIKRRINKICCAVNTISAIMIFGYAGSMEIDRINVTEFILLSAPAVIAIGISTIVQYKIREERRSNNDINR